MAKKSNPKQKIKIGLRLETLTFSDVTLSDKCVMLRFDLPMFSLDSASVSQYTVKPV